MKGRKVVCFCAILTAFPCAGLSVRAQPIRTIDELWAGFDARALPLEIEVVKAWDEGDIHLEMIYFTGEIFEGEKTRVFAYLGRPKKIEGTLPAVLHIHGGGQTARPDWPQFWAKRGYVCLSFDFCGDTNLPTLGPEYRRERFTLWRKVPADMMRVGGGMTMTPDPKRNPWLHWAMAARRRRHTDLDRRRDRRASEGRRTDLRLRVGIVRVSRRPEGRLERRPEALAHNDGAGSVRAANHRTALVHERDR
jgi:hypothetical protein